MSSPRESLASRMGFILLSAGCAIGLGNVWRFPFIVGRYGGCIFVLFYLLFLFIMGFPLLLTEVSIGRGSRKNLVHAMHDLAHTHKKAWGTIGFILLMGCLILMMYYTTVSGWLFAYTGDYMRGAFNGMHDASKYGEFFGSLVSNPVRSTISMAIVCLISGGVCAIGLKRGVESVVKVLMVALMLLILVLAIYAMTLPNAAEGLKFYLLPNVDNFMKNPMETIFAAMGQAFFTLSIGIGSMEIFGSYLDWKTSLTKECIWIIALDTFVAFSSGLIIFPVCASNNIDVSAGPPLIFVSLPSVFATLPGGQFWGFLFFLFLLLAALTTVIAVFENLIAYPMDAKLMNRPASSVFITLLVIVLSLPCVLGFSTLKFIEPLGEGSTILDLEDFIVSQNLLPIGGLILFIFAFCKSGWGQENFLREVHEGQSWRYSRGAIFYWKHILPVIIAAILLLGYYTFFK